jgi:hypothetical protein
LDEAAHCIVHYSAPPGAHRRAKINKLRTPSSVTSDGLFVEKS